MMRKVAFLVIAWSGTALADDAEYQRHYDKARELVRADDLRGGVQEFEAAYAASPKPEALFNLGVLYRKLALSENSVDDAQRSIANFKKYLKRYRAQHDSDPDDAEKIDRYMAELRQRFDIKAPEVAPAEPPASPPPVSVDRQAEGPRTPEPVPAPPPEPAKPAVMSMVLPLVIGLVALGSITIGGLLYAGAASSYNSVVPGCTPRCSPSTLSPIATQANFSYLLTGLGIAAAAADVALWVLYVMRRKPPESRPAVALVPGLGTLSVQGVW